MALLPILITVFLLSGPTAATIIGASYSESPSAPPSAAFAAVATLGLDSVRLDNPNAASVHAFLYSNTSLLLTLPNRLITAVAANRSSAATWLSATIAPFFPRVKIAAISVGDASLLETSPDLAPFLVPAARNLRLALADISISTISVSPTLSFLSVVTSFFPPSSAQFRQPVARNVVVPLLRFLRETNSSLMIAVHPYDVYRENNQIPVGFALFQTEPFNFRDDVGTGERYRNLFDVMVDAVVCALEAAGEKGVSVIVAETGWPSGSGDPAEVDANSAYAELYVRGLIRHLRFGAGTPLRKDGLSEVYVRELFDTHSNVSKRRWGILHPNMTAKYDVDFSRGFRVSGEVRLLFLWAFLWCVVFQF